MEKKYRKSPGYFQDLKPPSELFGRIILAIKREQEFQQKKKFLFGFFFLLLASAFLLPFSWSMLVSQLKNSGILHFISVVTGDFGTFLTVWQDFTLAILESLPTTAILFFLTNLTFFLFAIRLFLNQKGLFRLNLIP
jgi:hypothetical protein